MLLNSTQVAEKLGTSRGVALSMIKRGFIQAANPPDPTKQKYFPKVDSKILAEYIKTHGKPNGRIRRRKDVLPAEHGPEPKTPSADLAPQTPLAPVPSVGPGILTRIEERLTRIEEQLTTLVRIWS